MASDLKSRLSRIREFREKQASPEKRAGDNHAAAPIPAPLAKAGWVPAGYMTLRRSQILSLPFPIPLHLPKSLGILVPDIKAPEAARSRLPESLAFFDLETTGLSTGAGTVAFLAALGFLQALDVRSGDAQNYTEMEITQYLLLDYPGEADFLEMLCSRLGAAGAAVSYNGKTFDAQILRTRCLMNGIALPAFGHIDLLHPARRLWRRTLPNCSQATIETEILSLSREGDLSGAFAPDAWFAFLRSGDAEALLRICDHNSRDILGLASLFGCLCRIAAAPLAAEEQYRANSEQLYLCWRRAQRCAKRCAERDVARGALYGEDDKRTARALLEKGAAKGYPRCCRRLAIEAEWGRGDFAEALTLVEKALAMEDNKTVSLPEHNRLPEKLREDLERRRERLRRKSN